MYSIDPKHERHDLKLFWTTEPQQQLLKSVVCLTDGTCVLCEIIRLQKRVDELLAGNTDEVLRRRTAERNAKWMDDIQTEHAEWSIKNFGDHEWFVPMTGVTEETGELAHALLKQFQGIRGSWAEHELNAQDAIGDIIIYLMDLCNVKGWNLTKIIQDTWTKVVKKRDWKANPTNGNAIFTKGDTHA
jgi:NTP pyrophosphatase (non-canonical NTP hydrolase)